MSNSFEPPDKDTLRILIVTDTHLGYAEKDEIRGQDSFRTFDEALKIGNEKHCDLVLHGGDMFEKNRPSRNTMQKAMQILRTRTMGNKAINFEVVSDQTVNFAAGRVNFEDPNLNVAMPVFGIHGNHDDPAQFNNLSAWDVLSTAGLVNYFGRADNVDDVKIYPLLLKKGNTHVAIYGLGHIRDVRLHRAFHSRKVKFIRPAGEDQDKWFNIMVIHQNRVQRMRELQNAIPEDLLPPFLDVVYWAHEHECRVELEESTLGDFYVTQPGAPVATSFSQSEATKKYCGVMDIEKDSCRIVPFPLETVRPFVFDEIVLDDIFERNVEEEDIFDVLRMRVAKLIERAEEEWPGPREELYEDAELEQIKKFEPWKDPKWARIPICRIKVDWSGFTKPSVSRFGSSFVKKVANPDAILQLTRKNKKDDDLPEQPWVIEEEGVEKGNMEDIRQVIGKILQAGNKPLTVLAEPDFADAVDDYVQKEDKDAISKYVKKSLEKIQEDLGKNTEVKNNADIKKEAAEKSQQIRANAYQKHKEEIEARSVAEAIEAASQQAGDDEKEPKDEDHSPAAVRPSQRNGVIPNSKAKPKRRLPDSLAEDMSQPLQKRARNRKKKRSAF